MQKCARTSELEDTEKHAAETRVCCVREHDLVISGSEIFGERNSSVRGRTCGQRHGPYSVAYSTILPGTSEDLLQFLHPELALIYLRLGTKPAIVSLRAWLAPYFWSW